MTEPSLGGQHQYALLIVECLLKRANIEYRLIVLCANQFWRRWCRKNGVKYLGFSFPDISEKEKMFNYKFPFLAQLYYTYMTQLGEEIRKEQVDILFSVQQGWFIPNYKVKIISPVHDLMHQYEPGFPEVREDFKNREIYMKSIAKFTSCILVDSRLGKKQFKELYLKKGSRRLKIFSLPFVAPHYLQNTAEEYIEVPNKYIFYPAQFWKHKNHINLVKAIKIISETVKDIHLVLVGAEKNNYKAIKKYIEDNKLESHITILGFVSDENMVYLYRHAIGMVMPSYFGPTNIPPLEAMTLGCPVAVSNKYAMPEQVGNAGLLFNPDSPEEIADIIQQLWKDEELREKMKHLGYKRVRKWTEVEFGERLRKIISML